MEFVETGNMITEDLYLGVMKNFDENIALNTMADKTTMINVLRQCHRYINRLVELKSNALFFDFIRERFCFLMNIIFPRANLQKLRGNLPHVGFLNGKLNKLFYKD
jgi:hypothetical protein